MQDLISYIDNFDSFIEMSQFIRYCVSIGYTDVCRRDYQLLYSIILEHNSKYRS